ncbi:MAG TPA: gliding motility-associated C-terminal domain-containing protein [Chitinophagaceae bacterium]|nr:gliding motility-associated C-terminal domain-containing protein [Chitinophagaceae bacterium]
MTKRYILCLFILCFFIPSLKADRIYIMNSAGYNSAEPGLVAAMTNLGHNVTVNASGAASFPVSFTSRCIDSTNGYDWLCFFGNGSFASLLPQIQAFINVGGKVFYQYEVGCCTVSSADVATVCSGLTGLSITQNANSFLALTIPPPGWTAANLSCCTTFFGAAYKGLDGLPPANQLLVTGAVGSSFPSFTLCPNFGFVFTTNDFVGSAHKGGIVGIGDYNIWYDGQEPLSNGGFTPLNSSIVNYFFPNDTTTCFLLPPGCLEVYSGGGTSSIALNLGNDTTLCNGQNLTLNAGNAGATYLWQNGASSSTFTVTQAGTYWVKVTSSCGNATDTLHVNYVSMPTVNLGNDTTICQGQTITLQTNSLGSTYQWQDNSSNATFTVNQSGTYWVKVSNSCGNVTDTIHVTVTNLPIASLGNDTTLCTGNSMLLNVSTAGNSYLWHNGTTAPTFNVTQAGTYWVKVSNSCGNVTDTIHVNYQTIPSVNLGNDTTICQGQILTLQTNSIGSTYQWQDNSGNPTYAANQSGTYWVKVTNACGSVTDTIHVTVANPPLFNLGNDTTLCSGSSLLLTATTAGASYLWQNGSTGPTFNVSQSGTYWVKVTQNCSTVDTIHVLFNPLPIVNLGPDKSICFGDTLVLNVTSNNATYHWQDNSSNPTYKASHSGIYWVDVTVNQCTASDTLNLTVNPYFTVNIGSDQTLCEGDTLRLQTNNTNATYQWQDNSTWSYYDATETGTYSVEVSINNCKERDTAVVTFQPTPLVNLGPDMSLCKNETIQLNAYTTGATYTWQDNSHGPIFLVKQNGLYTVEVTVNNCSGQDAIQIDFDKPNCYCNVFVPNAFSPNNDLQNDELHLLSVEGIELKEFKIFNRWGNEVFNSTSTELGWDGKYKTVKAEIGTYFYYLRYVCLESGKEIVSKGDITLIY